MQGNLDLDFLEDKKDASSALPSLIATKRIGSTGPDLKPGEPPTVTLDPDQVEEINADDYSLQLFSATRIQPLSVTEIKSLFPEPSPKKAQSVMDRFLSVGLVHLNKEGRYYSNYPHYYVNWGKYRYEADIVARHDAKVFQLVKDFFGVRDFWKDKTYFSIDAFFTPEQSNELREMFVAIKVKAKQFAQQNAESGKLKGLVFRRLKFFDMVFSLLAVFLLSFGMVEQSEAQKRGGSGTDPVVFMESNKQTGTYEYGGSGTDPKAADEPLCLQSSDVALMMKIFNGGGGGHDPSDKKLRSSSMIKVDGGKGGGGYDPTDIVTQIKYSDEACKLGGFMKYVRMCEGVKNQFCSDVRSQAIKLWEKVQKQNDVTDI